jgi:hypothetical protein
MPFVSNVESRRVFELVTAFEERQITLGELQDELKPVSSETLQVVATFGSFRDVFESGTPRLYSARAVVRTLAAMTRPRC